MADVASHSPQASTGNLLLGGVLPLAAGGVYLVIVASVLGWWKPALREEERSHHKWPIIAPLFMALAVVLAASSTYWPGLQLNFLLAALTLRDLAGFSDTPCSLLALIFVAFAIKGILSAHKKRAAHAH
ncbi:hypothetical protein [uncultured Arthrobacter sp.]|uniref:hypothetical protein n=1 Tax=uncultured Arthrobacter sp. TaxID=114050 RepID=UPI0025E47783|nr:hypothetical protein [uncultured Arthrobacter sp.]